MKIRKVNYTEIVSKVIVGIFIAFTGCLLLFCIDMVHIFHITKPPEKFLREKFQQSVLCAYQAGFRFHIPILRQKTGLNEKHFFLWKNERALAGTTVHYTISPTVVMVINPLSVPNDNTHFPFPHELGHVIEFETHRKGHPAFDKLRNLGREEFADAIGEIILQTCNLPQPM